eukprot:gene36160-47015_t
METTTSAQDGVPRGTSIVSTTTMELDTSDKRSTTDTMLSDYKRRSRQVGQLGFLPRVQTGSMALSPSFSLPSILAMGNPSVDNPSVDDLSYCESNLSHSDGSKGIHSSSDQESNSQPYNPWKHPLSLYAIAIFSAWVYIIIPVTSFWEYALVRGGYYLITVVYSDNEFIDFCVPDALPITYISTYVISFMAVLVIRLIQGFLNLGNSSTINTEYILSTNITVTVMYALDVFVYNVKVEEELYPERLTMGMEVQIQGVENPLRENNFQDQKISLSSTRPVGSIWKRLFESNPQRTSSKQLTTRPQCALFDMFSISGCGAYSHVGCKVEDHDLPSRSAPRLAFLRVEGENHQAASKVSNATTATDSTLKRNQSNKSCLEIVTSVFLNNLPRSMYDRHLVNSHFYCVKAPLVLGSRKRLWLFDLFRSLSRNGCSDGTLIGLFFVYVIACTIFRVIIKRMGMECDKLKMNTASMFFLAEFFCLCFYYNFYRVLFESIPN